MRSVPVALSGLVLWSCWGWGQPLLSPEFEMRAAMAGIPIVYETAAVQSVPSTIPVELLRNPLKGEARKMVQEARRFMEHNSHGRAILRLEEALTKFPRSAVWVQDLLGVEYLKVGRFAEAAISLRQASKLLPRDATVHSNLGLSLALQKEVAEARKEVSLARRLDPGDGTIRELAQVLGVP
jgi:Tfp pilus assembly protein PilF